MTTSVPRATSGFAASATDFLRSQGLRASVDAFWQVCSAKWQLRKADSHNGARVLGRVWVRNQGGMHLGERLRFEGTAVRIELVTQPGGQLVIGERTYVNYGTNISAAESVRIGSRCAIGQYCIIMDNDYHDIHNLDIMPKSRPVVIGDRVWLGARVIVLPGSDIGTGSVIGANSVVRGTIPPGMIAAGVPARVIRPIAAQGENDV